MPKHKFNYKIILPLFLSIVTTACTVPFARVDNAPQEVEALAEQQISRASTWQQAYGEQQQQTINALPDVGDTEVVLKPLPQIEKPITDLWQRLRLTYAIPYPQIHKKTQQQLDWFVKHPEYIDRVVERARPYLHYIVEQIELRNMPMEIALLPVVESGFQPFAYSHGRAAGLWQFIPGTGEMYGLEQNWWYDGRRDIIESTRAALDYLQKLHNDFGDWQLALAAYNCGEGTVGRAIRKNKKAGKPTDFWSLKLPKETSVYVPKLMAIAQLVKHAEQYQIDLSPIDNSPYLVSVDIGSQIDLAVAAKLAQLTTDELYQLNPGFNRWATRPNGPHNLVVPLDKRDHFITALHNLPKDQRVQWTRHKIKSGESLGGIAQQYKTTIAMLKQANDLSGNTIRAGRHLLIPIASQDLTTYALTSQQRLAAKQNKPQRGNKKTHIVKAGDTWWDIAKLYKVKVSQLTKWNGKAPADSLQIGQKLVVWTEAPSLALNKKLRSVNYKIRSGDSLWEISQKFNVTVAQVREWNGLSDRTLLKPGQNITLYIDVTQQHGSI